MHGIYQWIDEFDNILVICHVHVSTLNWDSCVFLCQSNTLLLITVGLIPSSKALCFLVQKIPSYVFLISMQHKYMQHKRMHIIPKSWHEIEMNPCMLVFATVSRIWFKLIQVEEGEKEEQDDDNGAP